MSAKDVSKFLLMWKDTKKIIDVPDKDKVRAQDLEKQAREIFPQLEGQAIQLQLWNTAFEEFIDVQLNEEILPMSKLKIHVVSTVPSILIPVTIPLPTIPAEPEQSQDVRPMMKGSGWINTFRLPELPDLLVNKIQAKETLSSANESVILDTVFDAVQPHTLYPSPSDYLQLVEQLLSKYPLTSDLHLANLKELWVQKLKYKFQNTRKRNATVKEMLVVKSRKRKQPPAPKGTHLKKMAPKYAPMWGLQNYLPHRLESEDENTVCAHNKWLQIEIAKKRPDYKEVGRLMGLTFADRRRDIVQGEPKPISQRKEQYPWLFTEHELLAEFYRIHGSSQLKSLLQKGLDENASTILECYNARRKEDSLIPTNGSDDETTSAIVVLPSLLKEDIQEMFSSKEENGNAVYIEMNESSPCMATEFRVIAEGEQVCVVDDILTAVACYLCVFYTFHLQYIASLVKTITFYQFALLKISDSSPVEKPVLTLKARLDKKRPASRETHRK